MAFEGSQRRMRLPYGFVIATTRVADIRGVPNYRSRSFCQRNFLYGTLTAFNLRQSTVYVLESAYRYSKVLRRALINRGVGGADSVAVRSYTPVVYRLLLFPSFPVGASV